MEILYEIYSLDNNDNFSKFNANDIMSGTWALIPNNFDLKDEINENFVSFVNERSKYPTKPIKNINVLNEIFNNCVGNIKYIIPTNNNPKQFYENLISLQKYLKMTGNDNHPDLILIEDGSAKFSTMRSIGSDDLSPNNEDLKYNHVTDATQDEYELSERELSYMKGSKAVDIKKKCKLGGLGSTSAKCNQGDINNLKFKSL
jgi:hypothetical protein